MPRVKQTKMRLELDPEHPWKETVVYINYDNTSSRHGGEPEGGRFYVTLPAVVADALGQKEAKGKTQDEAFEAFEKCLKRFKNLKTERNRVILYQIKVVPNPNADSRYSWDTGYSVDIWAGTYEETVCIAGNDVKRYHYEKIESNLSYAGEPHVDRSDGERYDHQVPWTEKNEVFFKWVEDRMAELVLALAKFDEPAKLIETINTGKLLPLGRE